MKLLKQMRPLQILVFLLSVALFGVWFALNFKYLTAEQNGFIRFCLTACFSLIILLRAKKDTPAHSENLIHRNLIPLSAITGAVFVVIFGIIFEVHQFEWLGFLLLFFACMRWSLPQTYHRDVTLALVLLYWAHPLPSQIFRSLQFTMQKLSVIGGEWLLHIVNVRVWAEVDAFIIHTGLNVFEVPASCSGMRTATTVFLLGLGLGILKRFKWYECLLVALAALVQALILNILRISVMVAFSSTIGERAGTDFLHDTAGIIVIAGVFLVYLEIVLIERKHKRRTATAKELNPEHMRLISGYPPFWRMVALHKIAFSLGIIFLLLVAGLAFKSRSYHRAHMIMPVAELLRDSGNLEEAQKATDIVHKLIPKDEEWFFTRLRLLLIRGEYQQVLDELQSLLLTNEERIMERKILTAYCYMGLRKMNEAAQIVNALPEKAKKEDPRVAMILAEIGYYSDDPEQAAEYVKPASLWFPNTGRIRGLYPYLRNNRKWQAIADSHVTLPYRDATHALCAAEAHMNLNMSSVVADISKEAMQAWPTDLRALEPLFFMATKRWDTEWEGYFSEQLARGSKNCETPDLLYRQIEKCFQLGRPDLAWLICRQINEIDPDHPYVYMSLAQYGSQWFLFRKRHLGISANLLGERIDLRSYFLLGQTLTPWNTFCETIPYGPELSTESTAAQQKIFLNRALEEFKKRLSGTVVNTSVTATLHYEYIRALEVSGDIAGAQKELDRIVKIDVRHEENTKLMLAGIYKNHRDWQKVYEVLRTYLLDYKEVGYWTEFENAKKPSGRKRVRIKLEPLLSLCRAQRELHLNLAALYTAYETVRIFPNSSQATAMLVRTLFSNNQPEEALFVLSQPVVARTKELNFLEMNALFYTKRYVEMKTFSKSILLPSIPIPEGAKQESMLPPAEISLMWHQFFMPSDKYFSDNAKKLENNIKSTTNPFLKEMIKIWLEYYNDKSVRNSDINSLIKKWEQCGRDRVEKATALNQLTLLLCRDQKFIEARSAAGHAVTLFPESPSLWRILISLSNKDTRVIKAAQQSCPRDSEIWLASIATNPLRAGNKKEHKLSESVIRQLAAFSETCSFFSPAAVTRAGEYFFRKGMVKEASVAAHSANERARGLVPSYILGLICAINNRDKEWAFDCTTGAIKSSIHPQVNLYEKLVELKMKEQAIDRDPDTINALRNLRTNQPGDPLWAQMLGYVRFHRGGWEMVDTIDQMTSAIQNGATNKTPYIYAAEASRMLGNTERAADLLLKGLKIHPDSIEMLNNLVYTLASNPETISQAEKYIPKLIKNTGGNMSAMDTLVVYYIKSKQYKMAERELDHILKRAKEYTRPWFLAKVHQAEIMVRKGRKKEAEAALNKLLESSKDIPSEVIFTANQLLSECKKK